MELRFVSRWPSIAMLWLCDVEEMFPIPDRCRGWVFCDPGSLAQGLELMDVEVEGDFAI